MSSTGKVTLPPVSSFDPGHPGASLAASSASRPPSSSSYDDLPHGSSDAPTVRTSVYLPPLNNRLATSAAAATTGSMQPPPSSARQQKRSLEQYQFPRQEQEHSLSPSQPKSASESISAVKQEPSESPPHRSVEPSQQATDASASHAAPAPASAATAQDPPEQSPNDASDSQQAQPAGRKRRKVANLNTAKANGHPSPANTSKGPGSARRAGGAKNNKVSPLPLGQTTHKRTASGNLLYQPPDQPSPVSPIVMGFDAASALQDPSRAPTLRKSLSLKEQQKALIESRKLGGNGAPPASSHFPPTPGRPSVGSLSTSRDSGMATRGQIHANGRDGGEADDADITDAISPHAPSMAGKREKAKTLTIQTSTPNPPAQALSAEDAAEARLDEQRGLSQSIKSAPIRPSGYQYAAQNARLPPPQAGPHQRRASGPYELPPPLSQTGYPRRFSAQSGLRDYAPLTAGPRIGFPPDARLHPSQLGPRRLSPILSASDGPPTSLPPMRDAPPPPPPQSAGFANSQWGPGPPPPAAPARLRDRADMAASKANFLGLFEVFYDSLADSSVLQSNLEEQIRRSAVLLSSLSQSSSVFESMIDRRLNEMCTSLTGDLQVLEGRIERLEQAFETSQGSHLPPLTPHLSTLAQQQHHNPSAAAHSSAAQSTEHRRHSLADLSAAATSSSSNNNAAPALSVSSAHTDFKDATASAKSRLELLEQSATSLLDSRLSSHATSNLRGNEDRSRQQPQRAASSSDAVSAT